jgi:hypothetical protein
MMKKIIAYLLLGSIALLMIGMLSCKVQREVARSDLSKIESKTDIDLKAESHTEVKTSLDTGKVVNSTTTTTETKFGQFVDPKTGELISLPISQKTTETTTKTEQQGKIDESILSDQTVKADVNMDEYSKTKSKLETDFRTKPQTGWLWLIGVGAVAVVFVWVKLKPTNVFQNILNLIKKAFT